MHLPHVLHPTSIHPDVNCPHQMSMRIIP
jgi:hypothetical protein